MLMTAKTPFSSTHNQQHQAPLEKPLLTQKVTPLLSQAFVPSPLPMVKSDCRASFKTTFFKYSCIHFHYRLRTTTLFHAASLYINCLHAFHNKKATFSQDYLTIACLFISMKYEEIYPPKLHHLTSFFKCHIDVATYRKAEKEVFSLVEGDLDIQTPQRILDEYLLEQPDQAHSFAYYLLEISFFDALIPSTFETKEICLAIVYILSQVLKLTHTDPEIEKQFTKNIKICAKLIVTAKDRLKINELEYIHRKYSKEQNCKTQNHQVNIEKNE